MAVGYGWQTLMSEQRPRRPEWQVIVILGAPVGFRFHQQSETIRRSDRTDDDVSLLGKAKQVTGGCVRSSLMRKPTSPSDRFARVGRHSLAPDSGPLTTHRGQSRGVPGMTVDDSLRPVADLRHQTAVGQIRTKRRLNFRELYFLYNAHNSDSSVQVGEFSNSIDCRHAIENDPLSTGAGE